MARRQVVEIQCDRCHRVENQEIVSEDKSGNPANDGKELIITFRGKTVEYGDLCKRCREACTNYINSLTKKPDEEKAPAVPQEKVPEKVERTNFLGIGKRG